MLSYVEHTHPLTMLLAKVIMKTEMHGFPISMLMGLRARENLRAAGSPLQMLNIATVLTLFGRPLTIL